jgi:uncharacterized membrane protein
MLNILIILALLLIPFWLLAPFGVRQDLRGRISLALVFLFTGLGHFMKTAEMTQMLPDWVPNRTLIIQLTGVMELVAALALLPRKTSRLAGIFIIAFLIAVFPANISAAWHRVEFGGHGAGPLYLALRLPLQLFLIGWAWWFAVRPCGSWRR